MKKKPNLAYQRKRPRYKKKVRVGLPKPSSESVGGEQDDDAEDEETEAPDTMEARTLEAEAAYEFAGQDSETQPNTEEAAVPAPAGDTAPPPAGDRPAPPPPNDRDAQRREQEAARREQEAQRREADRQRREQERERREAERKERERRDQERRDQQRREQERRERERLQELRNLDIDSICGKAWDIYSAEVKEEGVELFPDNDARELAKRSFRLAEIFLLEEVRLRKLRSEPLPSPESATSTTETSPAPLPDAPSTEGTEPTMGE